MIITLLAVFLLAGLILYVLNLGQQVHHRTQTQNAADATVEAASKWTARQMNTIARNNAGIARYIAAVDVLDAAPQAAEYTLLEHEAFRDRLALQLGGTLGSNPANLYRVLDDLLYAFLEEIEAEIDDIRPVVNLFRSIDVEQMTHYNGGNGYLWQSMYAMDQMNQAIADNFGAMVQHAGISAADANLGNTNAAAVLLPLDPTLPHERGRFNDFEIPVRRGMLPPHADDRADNRGPWDTVYGWRDVIGYYEGGTFVPGSIAPAGGASGRNVGLSRGPGGNGRVVGAQFIPIGYTTYGPQSWMIRRFGAYIGNRLQNTRMDWYLNRIANHKLRYLWPNDLPPINANAGRPTVTIRPDGGSHFNNPMRGRSNDVFVPDWRTSFDEAVAIAEAGTPEIKETAYFVVEIKSRYPPDHSSFLSNGSWTTVNNGNQQDSPRLTIQRGWVDPRRWNVEQTGQWVWRDDWQYEVYGDSSIGITQIPRPDNAPDDWVAPTQTVYRVDHFIFAGVNVGDPANITNPYEGFNPDSDDAPAPIDIDHNRVSPLEQDRINHLSFLAVVRRSDEPQSWPTRFRGGKPYNNMVAMAQANVFNNHSWDMWTQMWHGQLQPITYYREVWLNRISEQMGDGAVEAGVNPQEVADLQIFMESLRDVAPALLSH